MSRAIQRDPGALRPPALALWRSRTAQPAAGPGREAGSCARGRRTGPRASASLCLGLLSGLPCSAAAGAAAGAAAIEAALRPIGLPATQPAPELAAPGHPFHRSEAEGELDLDSGRLEIALRIDSIELELALEDFAGRPLDLERPEQAEPVLFAYVRENVRAKSRWAAPAPGARPTTPRRPAATAGWAELHWVGYELEGLDAWLYFELELPPLGDQLDWCNALLTERHPFQENLTLLTDRRGRRAALRTTPDSPWTPVPGFLWRQDQRELPAPGWLVARPPFPHSAAWWQAQGQTWRR